ncbi:hypothetical protein TWF506_007527 [Arthrobotrys conoides]|uniref:Uncharacterized protein n=1 Tax=Arthrobotrys conoides TaxID=74498 RepID=A0AAN8NER9_9PEZI
MVVLHQSAAKRRWLEHLHSYHDWTAAHDVLSFAILSMDAFLTTLYFAISIFMTVYSLAMVDYLKEHATAKEGLSTVIRLLEARAGVTITMSYICLCAFFWLIKRLFIAGEPQLLAEEVDRKYEIYLRMYTIIILVGILRVVTFILACPIFYPKDIMKVRIPNGEFVAQPLIRERGNRDSDFIVGDIIIYFWGWSFLFLITAAVSLFGFLISADFVGLIIHPGSVHSRTKSQIFDLFFFTATQPLWTACDFLLLILEIFECLFRCIVELLCCRKPQAMSYFDDYSNRHIIGRIRPPRYYNEPRLSATYFWTGRAWLTSVRISQYIWNVIKTSVLGMWFSAKWWGMKVRWGIKLKKSRASGMTVILGPYQTGTVRGWADRGFFDGNNGRGPQTDRGQADQFEDIELGEFTRTANI